MLKRLTANEQAALAYDWTFWARPNQLEPAGDWRIWLLLAGRGFGKTRTGAEWIRQQIEKDRCGRLALLAPTAADTRDVMVEGESGILSISPNWNRPVYEPSKRRLTWPNGAIAIVYSADEPERLRGPQHDGAWVDELGAMNYPDQAWTQLTLGLRLGKNPRAVVTTTPKPIPVIKSLVKDPTCFVTRGTTYDNIMNLPHAFVRQIVSRYEGTRLGRQELMAEILEDIEGALWSLQAIEAGRVAKPPELIRIVVAIDPAATNTEDSDETGIIVAGLGRDRQGYVLADVSLESGRLGTARGQGVRRVQRRSSGLRSEPGRGHGAPCPEDRRPPAPTSRGACLARKANARRADRGTLRAGTHPSRRHTPEARGPDDGLAAGRPARGFPGSG